MRMVWVFLVFVVAAVVVGYLAPGVVRERCPEPLAVYGLPAGPELPLVVKDPVGELVCVWWANGELELRRDPETVIRLLLLRYQALNISMRKEVQTLKQAVKHGHSAADG